MDQLLLAVRLSVLLVKAEKKSEFSKNNIFYLPIHFKYIDILDANTSEMSRDPNKNVINCLELKTQDQSCVAL